MPISSHLLERAYQLINANQIQNAELVLDAVVRVDPQNIEAWITYLQIHQNRSDLDWLKDRILRTRELNDHDKKELLQYHDALIQHLTEVEEGTAVLDTSHVFNFKTEHKEPSKSENALFELLDVFDYPSIKNEPIAGRRQKNRQWLGINLASPANQAIALLLIFLAAVRLVIGGYFLGYLFLGLFLVGCFYWLSNYKSQRTINTMDPARMYLLDTKNKLTIADKKTESKRKSKGKKTPKL